MNPGTRIRYTSETLDGLKTASAFDGEGNETQLTYPGDRQIVKTYDELDRIATITDTASTGTLASYSYAGPNRVSRRDYGNGTRWAVQYDGINNARGDGGPLNAPARYNPRRCATSS